MGEEAGAQSNGVAQITRQPALRPQMKLLDHAGRCKRTAKRRRHFLRRLSVINDQLLPCLEENSVGRSLPGSAVQTCNSSPLIS